MEKENENWHRAAKDHRDKRAKPFGFLFLSFFSIYVSNAPRQEKINESCASVKAKQIVSADSPVKSVLHNIQHSISTEAIESFVYPAFHFCSDN